jgi:hypothetical protein
MYVGIGKRGRGGRLAGTHRVSGLRGAQLRGLRGLSAYQRAVLGNPIVAKRLGQLDYDSEGNYIGPTVSESSSSSGLSPQTAQLLTSAINAAGQVGVRAVTPVPTIAYNTATGLYTATGGAALPAAVTSPGASDLSMEISSYFPLLLLLGGGVLLISFMKR